MARKNRIWYPNAMYHITSRGNRRSDIYKDEEDHIVYLNILKESLEHYSNNYDVISYCLMTNHVHLQVKTKEKHIKYFMGRLNGFYAKYFNNKYNCVGHLFQERYGSEIIENDRYALELSRYIHLNPVKANMVKCPEDYEWSSYSTYIEAGKENFISSERNLLYFNEENKHSLYKQFVESAMDYDDCN